MRFSKIIVVEANKITPLSIFCASFIRMISTHSPPVLTATYVSTIFLTLTNAYLEPYIQLKIKLKKKRIKTETKIMPCNYRQKALWSGNRSSIRINSRTPTVFETIVLRPSKKITKIYNELFISSYIFFIDNNHFYVSHKNMLNLIFNVTG